MIGAAADRLDAHGARAGVQVGEAASGDSWREDVEQRLAQTVAGGAGFPCHRDPGIVERPMSSCNDAHHSIIARRMTVAAKGRGIQLSHAQDGVSRSVAFSESRYAFHAFVPAPARNGDSGRLHCWREQRARGVGLWLLLLFARRRRARTGTRAGSRVERPGAAQHSAAAYGRPDVLCHAASHRARRRSRTCSAAWLTCRPARRSIGFELLDRRHRPRLCARR